MHVEGVAARNAEPGHVEVHHGLAHRVRVDVGDDEEGIRLAGAGERRVEVLAVDEDRIVVARVDVEVAQLAERRMLGADAVQQREVRRKGLT